MTYLLDVNVLIALAWPSHIHHALTQEWFKRNRRKGWSSCPITQTAFARISSNPKFIDAAVTPNEAIELLRTVTNSKEHEFWPDDLNVTNSAEMPTSHLLGHRQLTDAYLLGLAIQHKGKLATLDAGIESLIPNAQARQKHLEIIEA